MVVKNFIEVNHEYHSHENKDVKSKLEAGTAVTHIEIKTVCNKVNRLCSNLVLVAHGTCHDSVLGGDLFIVGSWVFSIITLVSLVVNSFVTLFIF